MSFGSIRRGAYTDSKGIRWDPNDADYEGILYKQSRWMREWRSRYFILKGSKIFYAKSSTVTPHGVIDLIDCLSVKSTDLKTKKKYSFEICTNEEVIQMYADSEEERNGWITAIQKAIFKHSSMMNDQEYFESESDNESNDTETN
mmetsp:Transcript_10173/g.10643  ORF Transcript_10173/g.10643 Transcript_10173/m.10643 type:complete len:145 (+) Transcript_10173:26-460(+)